MILISSSQITFFVLMEKGMSYWFSGQIWPGQDGEFIFIPIIDI